MYGEAVLSCEVLIGHEWVKVEETADEVLERLDNLDADHGEISMDSWIVLTYIKEKMLAKISTRVIYGVREFSQSAD
jgi:hypothetical protein